MEERPYSGSKGYTNSELDVLKRQQAGLLKKASDIRLKVHKGFIGSHKLKEAEALEHRARHMLPHYLGEAPAATVVGESAPADTTGPTGA